MFHGKFKEYYNSLTEPSVASHFDFFESCLKKRYVTDKNNGKLKQYWNDRKLVQEEEKTNKAAAIQTSISINRATTRVLQSADKQVENRLNKADERNLPGLPVSTTITTSYSTKPAMKSSQASCNDDALSPAVVEVDEADDEDEDEASISKQVPTNKPLSHPSPRTSHWHHQQVPHH
ncbi:hypothetical protein EMPS_04107 [Entomortierella parvispora]|uniref:Uncharacterized protein n=1 Tax=Entomortierella parvispora TaxID=205924 RepID=A0A9P3H832_9FUNG|nr:hypothetical protein EMPS_04107 [Entomortierella parvispora]